MRYDRSSFRFSVVRFCSGLLNRQTDRFMSYVEIGHSWKRDYKSLFPLYPILFRETCNILDHMIPIHRRQWQSVCLQANSNIMAHFYHRRPCNFSEEVVSCSDESCHHIGQGVGTEGEDRRNLFMVAMTVTSSLYSINRNGIFSWKEILIVITS